MRFGTVAKVAMKIELPPDGKPSALLRVKEWGPLEDGESELSRFMADMGLLGERLEIKSDSLSVKLFEMLLNSGLQSQSMRLQKLLMARNQGLKDSRKVPNDWNG